mmetsp:Transcript_11872/g.23004  ORF Transcript_11872/g.23004 Transcript_11872/m.23004 type:complete len:237 (-) Transcript_11872:72-782(-)
MTLSRLRWQASAVLATLLFWTVAVGLHLCCRAFTIVQPSKDQTSWQQWHARSRWPSMRGYSSRQHREAPFLPRASLRFASGAEAGLRSTHPHRGVALHAVENPYKVLGIPKGTSKPDTRKHFRKLAATEHPDVNQDDPDAPDRFQKLVDAYNTIMGDQLLPDEMLIMRVKNTKRYQKKMKKELDQGGSAMYMGNARLIQAVATVAFFSILAYLGTLSPDQLEKLLVVNPNTPQPVY